MLAPARILGEQANRRQALLLLADALERLVAAGRRQQREAVELVGLLEQVAAEHRTKMRRLAERREHEEHEAALGAVATPRARAQRRIEAEDRVAARERRVVAIEAREGARDRELGGRSQDREQLHLGSQLGQRGLQQAFGTQALAELMVYLDAVPAQ